MRDQKEKYLIGFSVDGTVVRIASSFLFGVRRIGFELR